MAARYFINGGVNNNWGDTSNWSTASGGAGGSSVPTSADDVFLDGNSPNCVIAIVARNAKSLTFTGYTNTLSFDITTRNLTIAGNIIFSNTMTITGTGMFNINTTASITSNGFTVPSNFTFAGAITITLVDNLTITGNVTMGTTGSEVFNGNTFTIGGSLSIVNNVDITGTTNFVLNGTGTLSHTGVTTWGFKSNLTINTSGTITLASTFKFGDATLTYLGGTVITSGNTLTLVSSCTVNTGTSTIDMPNGIIWNNIDISTASTITNNSLLTATGTLSLPNASVIFGGTHPFTVGHLSNTAVLTVARTYTLSSGLAYNVTTSFVVTGSSNSLRASFVSSTPGVQAILTLDPAATQNVMYTNATDIDSSLGQTIWSFQQVVSNTLNWGNLNVSNIGGGGTFTFVN